MSLPSIITTYCRVFKLYKETYIELLPFALLEVVGQFFISKVLPLGKHTPHFETFLHLSLQSILSCVLYSFVIYGLFVRYQQEPFNYLQIVKKGIVRVIPLLLSGIILVLPIIILFSLIVAGEKALKTSTPSSAHFVSAAGYVITAFILCFYAIIILTYSYVVGVLVVIRNTGAWEGIKRSWMLVKGHWWYTFGLMVVLMVILGVCSWVLRKLINDNIAAAIVTLFSFSLGPCLMLIHCENLEKVHQEK